MNTKEILSVWKNFLNENRIIPLAELLDIITSSDSYSDSDAEELSRFWKSNQFSSKYSQVIKSDLLKGEPVEHIIDTVISHHNKVYKTIGPKDKDLIGNGSYTTDDLRKQLDAKVKSGKFNKQEVRSQCEYRSGRPVVGKYKDFDVVYSERDWIVVEPKSILGSIAWAHGKPDGTEETDQSRRVGWCTGVSTANNMFANYAGNLHMFYLIKSDYDNISGPDRRLCLSFIKNDNGVSLSKGHSSVDANNKPLSLEYVKEHVRENIVNLIKSIVEERKETSFVEIYSKITLSQLIRQINQMKSQGISEENIEQELSNYALYAKSEEVVNYLMTSFTEDYDLNFSIKSSLASRKDVSDFAGGSLINTLVNDEDPHVRAALAKNDIVGKEILLALTRDEDSEVRDALASNASAHQEILFALARDEEPRVRATIASNSNLPEKVLFALARDEDSGVRAAIAYNTSTPQEILFALARDEEPRVRATISYNTSTPQEILLALARDESYTVKNSTLYNKATPKEAFLALSRDEDPQVRKEIASNSKTPEEVLLALTKDENKHVRAAIASNTSATKKVLLALTRDEDSEIKTAMAYNNSAPQEILLALARDEDPRVRSKVASNSSLPEKVLLTLAKDEDKYVRCGVIDNRSVPEKVLLALTKDEDAYVRLHLATSPNTPKSVLSVLVKGEDEYVAYRANETLKDVNEKFLRSYIKLLIN